MSDNNKPKGPEIKIYKRVDDLELGAHIFYPGSTVNSEKNPGFVFFHPGGWTEGEPLWGYDLCMHYALKGMTTISFQYRLSSPGGYTPIDAISDARSAISWTREHAEELKIDTECILAGGISAGAHIVTCAAFIQDADYNSEFNHIPNALAFQSACLNPVVLGQYFADLLQGADPEKYSPFHHIRPGLPPMCLIHGTADDIVPFYSVKEFTERMNEAGNRCDLHPFEGVDHFFSNVPDGSRVYKLVDDFFISLGYLGK